MIFHKYKIKTVLVVALCMVAFLQSVGQQLAEKVDTLSVGDSKTISILHGERSYERFVGNVNSVTGEELENYPALDVREALAGKLPGLFILQNNGNIGVDVTVFDGDDDDEEDNFNMFVRGNVGDYIVMIDGFERPFANLNLDQIAEIKVLKDPVSKSMFGGRMSNGIIMITTKRGKVAKNEFRAKIQRGMKMPTQLPEYLNAPDFARYYNQALANDNGGAIPDGLGYSEEAIAAYADQSKPLQYPDVDFYDEFLNNSMDVTRFSAEYTGGTEKTRYYFHTGIQNEGGFEKYGDNATNLNMYHLRGNLDANFNEDIKVIADFSGYLGEKRRPKSFNMSTLSSRYPNAYPIFVAPDSVGGTSTYKDNPYGAQAQSGFIEETYVQMQTNLGFVFNLDNAVKGLQVKPSFSFDIYHQQNLNKGNTVGIYEITEFDENGNPLTIVERQKEKLATSQTLGDDEYVRRWGLNVLTSWNRVFGEHAVDADLLFNMSQAKEARRLDDYKRENITVRSNYAYKGKYNVEGSLNYSGSMSYAKDNRFKLFPALGAGWLISKEDFLIDNSAIDFLRVNAAWGIMGDGNIPNRLWIESWGQNVDNYRINSSNLATTAHFTRIANADIDWPTLREIDVNLEARLWKKLGVKVTYFDYLTKQTLSKGNNLIPGILGGTNYLPQQNFGENSLKGTEAELSYAVQKGDWTFEVLTHMTLSKSEKIKINELADPNYSTVGDAVDDIRGYNAVGFYTQQDIDDAISGAGAAPSYMDPADLRVGNIKYEDINSDKVIDKYDKVVIGNSSPRLMYGANFKVGYKGFDLYASFLGYGKYQRLITEDNSYFHAYQDRKYSNAVVDGLPNGNAHPLLTTGTPTNDTQTSSYWIANGSFLKLKNVSLSYTLPQSVSDAIRLGEVKLYVYGSNLFTVSKIKELDPESLNAGLTDYPLFSTYAMGLSISF